MNRRIIAVLVLVDAIAMSIAGLAAVWLRFGSFQVSVAIELDVALEYWQLALIVPWLWLPFLALEGLYDLDRLSWSFAEISRIAKALALGVVGVIILTFAVKLPGLSRWWLLVAWLLSVALVFFGRLIVQRVLSNLRRRGKMLYRTLVVGTNAEALRIVTVLGKTYAHGILPIGCLSSPTEDAREEEMCAADVPCLGLAEDIADVVHKHDVDTVVIASSAFDHDVIAGMISELRQTPVRVHISSGLFEVLTARVFVREVAGVPLITIKRLGFTALNRVLKRAFDILVSLVLIVIGSPLWIALAVAIKVTSAGPVFYRQERVGRGGACFRMFKYRSMVADADSLRDVLDEDNEADGPIFKMRNDPRVTSVGRFMRKFSLDEFPQLINVFIGDMSLVGPRPPLPSETEQYGQRHWRRMEVPPGMTGLWQVSGRSDLSFDEMVRLDLFYIENWSLMFDIALILRTVPAVFGGKGAY